MKNKTYLFLAFLALFSIASNSYFHVSDFDIEHALEHEHEEEICDHCSVAEISFFIDENFINENLNLENYFFSDQTNLINLFNHHLSIRAPQVS